jgi:hypothetical protein
MADIEVEWEVEGILTPRESVEKMLAVIPGKGIEDTGTFWTWEGKVRVNPFYPSLLFCSVALLCGALRDMPSPIGSSARYPSLQRSKQALTNSQFRYIPGDTWHRRTLRPSEFEVAGPKF